MDEGGIFLLFCQTSRLPVIIPSIPHPMDEQTKKKDFPIFSLLGASILLVIAFFAGSEYRAIFQPGPNYGEGEIRENSDAFKLINPLLECDLGGTYVGRKGIRPSQQNLEKIISRAKANGDASYVALYFRDLNNGPWIGINERAEFTPASLLKIPLMIYFLKKSETDPGLLKKEIAFTSPIPNGIEQHFKPLQTLENGHTYTIEELVERAIIYSDNHAASALVSITDENPLYDLFKAMHLELPQNDQTDDFFSVKDYAAFFRILFNSSYLDNEHSEHALQLLSQSTFDQGLTAKLPKDLVVAHKFGERFHATNDEKQVHDCGIIYYPNNPYLLCVMTRGYDMHRLAGVIADLSKQVYEETKRQAVN